MKTPWTQRLFCPSDSLLISAQNTSKHRAEAQESAGWMPGRLNEWTATVTPARLWVKDHETPALPLQQYHSVHLQQRIYHQLVFHLSLSRLCPIKSKPPLERRLFPSHSFIAGCPEPRTVQHMKQKDSIKCVQHEWTPNFPRSNSTQTRARFLETGAYLHLKSW